jgi:iron complex outermembrane receptor protein
MKFIKTALIAFSVSFFHISYSQTEATDTTKNKVVKLGEVEITELSDSSRSLYQPVAITKLSSVELKRGTGLYLDDAINQNVPGVFMQRRSVSGGQQFNIRGYGNGTRGTNGVSSNFDGQGYKVYLNGIPVTDAEGITLMDDIDFGSIGNVEVIKGPAGTLYGLAIAGVVNLKTAIPAKGKTSVGQDVLFGSYGLSRLTTHVELGGEKSSFLVNYGHQTYDGFVVHTASHKDFVNVMGNFQPNEKQSVNVYAGYSNSYDERQGELTLLQYDTMNYSGNPAYIKNNAHSNIISFRAGVGHTYTFNKYISNTLTVFGSGVSNNASSAGGWTDKTPVNYGARTTFDLKFMQEKKFRLNGVVGAETQQQFAQVIGYAMVANPNPDPYAYNSIGAARSNQAYRTETSSVFTEWTLAMPKDFSLTAGIGLSNMLITLNDRFYVATNTNPVKYSKGYDNMFSPHVAFNKVFNKHISAYISYSKGYKAPVSSYFFIPTTGKVNTDLKPETGDQFEIGSKGELMKGKLYYELAIFDALFTNKMTTVAVPLDPPAVGTAYTYIVNRGGQDDKGVEALLKYTLYSSNTGFFKAITPFVNFCYSDFRYVNYTFQTLSANKKTVVETDYSGNAVAGVAPITTNAGVDISTKIGLYANVNYLYRDGMPITSDGLNRTSSYSLLNAKLGFHRTFLKHFEADVYAGAQNIMSEKYSYMVFVNQLPDAYMPAPNEINYFGGVNLKFNF